MRNIESLQGVRGIAALMVLLYHTQIIFTAVSGITPFGNFFINGDKGVDLFFVLSGFIMAYVHFNDAGRPDRLGPYLFSRITRLYPLMWFMSAAALLIYVLGFNTAKGSSKLTLIPLLQSVLLLPQDTPALVNVTWTLKYEIFFYAAFALTIVNRTLGYLVLAGWQLVILFCIVMKIDTSSLWAFYARPIGLEFGLGLAAAWGLIYIARKYVPFTGKIGTTLLIVGVGAFSIFFLVGTGSFREFTFGLAGAFVVAGCGLRGQSGKTNIPSLLVRLGDASYAIYLVNFAVITLLATLIVRKHLLPVSDVVCAAVAIVALAAGMLLYVSVDRPIVAWARSAKQKRFSLPARP